MLVFYREAKSSFCRAKCVHPSFPKFQFNFILQSTASPKTLWWLAVVPNNKLPLGWILFKPVGRCGDSTCIHAVPGYPCRALFPYASGVYTTVEIWFIITIKLWGLITSVFSFVLIRAVNSQRCFAPSSPRSSSDTFRWAWRFQAVRRQLPGGPKLRRYSSIPLPTIL